jgi:hypothetical protein
MENVNKIRLKEMCCKVWSLLTQDEKERYFDCEGTIEFVSDVATILGTTIDNTLTEDELDEVLDKLND